MAQVPMEDFARGAQQILGRKPGEPEPRPVPKPVSRHHWTQRTDQIGVVRLAPRRGYGQTDALFIRVYMDGSIVVDNEELPPAYAAQFIQVWYSGRGEFERECSMVAVMYADWNTYADGKRGFVVRIWNRLANSADAFKQAWGISEREANRGCKEVLLLRKMAKGGQK